MMIKELISYYEKFLKTERDSHAESYSNYFWDRIIEDDYDERHHDYFENLCLNRTHKYVDAIFARFKDLFMDEETYLTNVEQQAGWALPNDDYLEHDSYIERAYCKDGELTEEIAKFHFGVLCEYIEKNDINIDDY